MEKSHFNSGDKTKDASPRPDENGASREVSGQLSDYKKNTEKASPTPRPSSGDTLDFSHHDIYAGVPSKGAAAGPGAVGDKAPKAENPPKAENTPNTETPGANNPYGSVDKNAFPQSPADTKPNAPYGTVDKNAFPQSPADTKPNAPYGTVDKNAFPQPQAPDDAKPNAPYGTVDKNAFPQPTQDAPKDNAQPPIKPNSPDDTIGFGAKVVDDLAERLHQDGGEIGTYTNYGQMAGAAAIGSGTLQTFGKFSGAIGKLSPVGNVLQGASIVMKAIKGDGAGVQKDGAKMIFTNGAAAAAGALGAETGPVDVAIVAGVNFAAGVVYDGLQSGALQAPLAQIGNTVDLELVH